MDNVSNQTLRQGPAAALARLVLGFAASLRACQVLAQSPPPRTSDASGSEDQMCQRIALRAL